jgi:hypothetical protein
MEAIYQFFIKISLKRLTFRFRVTYAEWILPNFILLFSNIFEGEDFKLSYRTNCLLITLKGSMLRN